MVLHTKASWLMSLTLQAWSSKLCRWKSHFKAHVPLILRHTPIIKAISAWSIPVSKGFALNRLSCSQLFGVQTRTITHRTVSVLLSGLYNFAKLIQLQSFSLSFRCLWGKMWLLDCYMLLCLSHIQSFSENWNIQSLDSGECDTLSSALLSSGQDRRRDISHWLCHPCLWGDFTRMWMFNRCAWRITLVLT